MGVDIYINSNNGSTSPVAWPGGGGGGGWGAQGAQETSPEVSDGWREGVRYRYIASRTFRLECVDSAVLRNLAFLLYSRPYKRHVTMFSHVLSTYIRTALQYV